AARAPLGARLSLGPAASGEDDLGALGDEELRRGRADAAGGAGDDRDFAVEQCHVLPPSMPIDGAQRRYRTVSSMGTIILPIGQSARPASFRCAQAKGRPMIVMASTIAVIRCPSASHQPASTSQIRLPIAPSAPVPISSSPV